MKKLRTPQKYKAQIEETKREILKFVRKRLAAETNRAAILGSTEVKKMATFLEQFIQGLTTEERYFFRISIIYTPIQVLILNNLEFTKYLPVLYFKYMRDQYYEGKLCVQ